MKIMISYVNYLYKMEENKELICNFDKLSIKSLLEEPLLLSWINGDDYWLDMMKKSRRNKDNKLEKDFAMNITKKYFKYKNKSCM